MHFGGQIMPRSKFLLMIFAAAMSFHAGAAWSAEPVKIRVSWIAPISNWGSLLLEKKELARHLGKSYVLEPVRYAGTPQMITALANGELEIANLAFSTLPIAIQNANLDDLRVIADEFQDGVPGYYSQEYMVLSDGPIKKIEDLKGKVVAINAAAAPLTLRSARCCAGAVSKTNATTSWWRRRFRRCGPCLPKRRPTSSRSCRHSRSTRRCGASPSRCSSTATFTA